MALQLWMPLMGDLYNQGLSDYSISTLGTLSWVNGKLGQQAMKAGDGTQVVNGVRIEDTFTDLLNGDYSVSVWIKPYGQHVHYNGSIFSSGNWNTLNKRWAFGVNQNNTKVDVLCSNYNTYVDCNVPVNEWTHLVCTCGSDRIVKLYKNGEYIASLDRSTANAFDSDNVFTCIGRESYANGYFSFNGAIQDFRLYDHCLSELEIKQLSQGLILHYPLNRIGFGQENLVTQEMINAEPWASAIQGNYTIDGKTGWILYNSLLYSKSGNGANNIFSGLTYDTNTQYTISFKWRDDYRTDGKSSSLYIRFKYSDGTYSQVISSKDYNYWKEEIMTSTAGKTVTAITTTYGNGGKLLFTDLKLEKGKIKTPTSPIVNSDLYDSMGLNSKIEYDISGYCNNGTRTGAFSWTSDTPKYTVSTEFNGSECILRDSPGADIYTLTCWAKTSKSKNTAQFMVVDSNSRLSISFYGGNIISYFYGNSAGTGSKCKLGTEYKENEWNFFAVVKTGENTRDCYCNGVKLTPTSNDWWSAVTGFFVGNRSSGGNGPFYGEICDVRAYATALSADDILSLYKSNRL